MVKIDLDWWKTLFDETYLVTDARSVCNDRLTCREVDFLVEVLKLEKSWPIIDLCGGQGRHSLELTRRGFHDITVLDYSKILIDMGRERALKEALNTRFVWKDARDTGLPGHSFRVVMIMASSFGYFVDEVQNDKILREAFRLLMPEGIIFLDLPNREHVLKNFTPQSWHEANEDTVVCRERSLDEDIIYSREMVISKTGGVIRDAGYCTRLYSPEKITNMLTTAGFSPVIIQKNFISHEKKMGYGLMTNRMLVSAYKE